MIPSMYDVYQVLLVVFFFFLTLLLKRVAEPIDRLVDLQPDCVVDQGRKSGVKEFDVFGVPQRGQVLLEHLKALRLRLVLVRVQAHAVSPSFVAQKHSSIKKTKIYIHRWGKKKKKSKSSWNIRVMRLLSPCCTCRSFSSSRCVIKRFVGGSSMRIRFDITWMSNCSDRTFALALSGLWIEPFVTIISTKTTQALFFYFLLQTVSRIAMRTHRLLMRRCLIFTVRPALSTPNPGKLLKPKFGI